MRSLTYLQPGENATCIGCHEDRTTVPGHNYSAMARLRSPSAIKPGPDGSKPLCYPILVQPVLDLGSGSDTDLWDRARRRIRIG